MCTKNKLFRSKLSLSSQLLSSLCYSGDLSGLVSALVTTPRLRVWAAGIVTDDVPSVLQRRELRLMLRAAPRLVGEVQAGFDRYLGGNILPYAAGPGAKKPPENSI